MTRHVNIISDLINCRSFVRIPLLSSPDTVVKDAILISALTTVFPLTNIHSIFCLLFIHINNPVRYTNIHHE
jgi:hypothetical protein